MKLLERTENKRTKDENCENVLSTTIINKIQEPCINCLLINHLVNYQIFHPRIEFLETFDSEFSYNEVWFTDQNSKH